MAKAPAFQFYPGDWLRDTALRACSLPARGLWIDMLCIMHQGEPYGHLTLKGNPIDAEKLARMVGGTMRDVTGRLAELEDAGVFSRTDAGTIYSRRMVDDERVRKARAAGGHKGGNPALKARGKVIGKVNLPTNLELTPSSSSSSSSSSPSIPHGQNGERERLILIVAGRDVHEAEPAVDDALARGCTPDQIADLARSREGKALLTSIRMLQPQKPEAKRAAVAQSREDRKATIVRDGRRANLPNSAINQQLKAEGFEPLPDLEAKP